MDDPEAEIYEDQLYGDADRIPSEDEEDIDLDDHAYNDGDALAPKPTIERGGRVVEEEVFGSQVLWCCATPRFFEL